MSGNIITHSRIFKFTASKNNCFESILSRHSSNELYLSTTHTKSFSKKFHCIVIRTQTSPSFLSYLADYS